MILQFCNHHNDTAIQNIIDQKTKPIGALGKLESLAKYMALILILITHKAQLPLGDNISTEANNYGKADLLH